MNKILRIGTRDSELAIYQAKKVQEAIKKLGKSSELKLIKSSGDKNLIQPIYKMGIQGVFTKALGCYSIGEANFSNFQISIMIWCSQNSFTYQLMLIIGI